ncbi:DUF2336 domain-containing protein [Methylobacterium gnaphalii]|uniref:DUF2336 domain-containing protein n=1 Tax=Methylobacterium gnaphalii TaxID=1010610 RepID=UPI001EE17248|nr:DUF2336 domain-containing protein [Methylobacterium gnaphalii]
MPQIGIVSRLIAEQLTMLPNSNHSHSPAFVLLIECIISEEEFRLKTKKSRILDETLLIVLKFETAFVRKKTAEALAMVRFGPVKTICSLAQDLDPDIASPVLQQSIILTEDNLILVARTRSFEHVLAITKRRRISKALAAAILARVKQKIQPPRGEVNAEGNIYEHTRQKFLNLNFPKENIVLLDDYRKIESFVS